MPRGGKREGAGAPKGNQNALKHGGRSRVLYGVPLNKHLTEFEYKALCMMQLGNLKEIDELNGGWISPIYQNHKIRYQGAVIFRETRSKTKCIQTIELRNFLRLTKNINKLYKK